jgi:tRNA pseudouridine55 synthase
MTSGILNVLKPPGMTSHDVVDFVRRLCPRRAKVGHAGTLDPGAAGVLVVCVGPATRLIEYVVEGDKEYRAEACLGVVTDTLDAEGEIVAERDASGVTEAQVTEALASLVGPQMMTPPMYSARLVGGKRLYELAREGRDIQREARPVTVHSADLVRFEPGPRARALADFRCSKGTYVRVLCEQLGERLGVGAHLSFLVRTAVGPHRLSESASLEELLAEAARRGTLEELGVPLEVALGDLPEVRLGASGVNAFGQGTAVACSAGPTGIVRVHDPEGALVGIGEVTLASGRPMLRPRKVIASR